MTQPAIRHFEEDGVVSFTCALCPATHVEARGKEKLSDFARWVIARERWTRISGKGEPLALACAECSDRRRRKEADARAAARFREWLKKKRAEEARKPHGMEETA